MCLLRRCRVNAALTIQLFSQLFHFINMWLFNRLVTDPESGLCSHYWGAIIRQQLGHVEAWAEKQGLELAADCHLSRIVQVRGAGGLGAAEPQQPPSGLFTQWGPTVYTFAWVTIMKYDTLGDLNNRNVSSPFWRPGSQDPGGQVRAARESLSQALPQLRVGRWARGCSVDASPPQPPSLSSSAQGVHLSVHMSASYKDISRSRSA